MMSMGERREGGRERGGTEDGSRRGGKQEEEGGWEEECKCGEEKRRGSSCGNLGTKKR